MTLTLAFAATTFQCSFSVSLILIVGQKTKRCKIVTSGKVEREVDVVE
jgi:hypothetical protein